MLRALGIIFLVLLVMLMAVGGGFLSHFLTRMNSPQVQNHNLQQVNHAVSPGGGGYPANYQPAPLPFPQSSQMQAVPVQQQINPIPVTVNQNPLSQQTNALRQVNAVTASTVNTMLAPATALQTAEENNTFKITEVESDGVIIWRGNGLLNHGKKEVLIKSGTNLKITVEHVSGDSFVQNRVYALHLITVEGDPITKELTTPLPGDGNTDSVTFDVAGTIAPGVYHLRISSQAAEPTVWTEAGGSTNIIFPEISLKPTISSLSVQKYGSETFAKDKSYGVYDGYLRIDVSSSNGQETFAFVNNENQFVKYISPVRSQKLPDSSGLWRYEVKIPNDTTLPGKLYVLRQQDNNHAYSQDGIKVEEQLYNRNGLTAKATLVQKDHPEVELKKNSDNQYFYNQTTFTLKLNIQNDGTGGNVNNSQLVVQDSNGKFLGKLDLVSDGPRDLELELPNVGKYTLVPMLMQGEQAFKSTRIDPIQISIATEGPIKGIIDASSFSQIAIEDEVTISFDKNYPVDESTIDATLTNSFALSKEGGNPANLAISSAEYLSSSNAIKFKLANASSPGLYHLEIKDTVKDLHGIALTGTYDVPKLVVSGDVTVGITRGLHGSTGNYVQYPEYTPPRENSVGFNPSDKVVTRVARLYYFRDAHRVAQIINRKIRSYNRHGVEMKNQLAGEALKKAEAATDLRKQNEKNAINAAVKTREAEAKLEDLQQALSRRSNETQQIQRDIQEMEGDLNRQRFLKSRDYANLPGLSDSEKKAEQEELQKLNEKISQEQTEVQLERARLSLSTANTDSALTRSRIQTAQTAVETARAEEIRLNDEWEVSQRKEERAYAEEFRKRVAAAHEDPDSYAEGVPNSKDPVEQVSLSVIGTGLIQLRGPLKGVNEVRTMINQIDAPVGQVRITLHTVQINGEHADRMEKVAMQIQRYIDHSRFLTMQSAQMLRNSIVKIASQKAAQVDAMCPE
ncbi:MAG: hypothetical protein KDA74_02255, partial [Planctomycetaceae bacterium]|nr:hypothetical protein [Planctomycetaceae bacterium]